MPYISDNDYNNDLNRRTDLRTIEPHYSAREVFAALESPYPGTTCKDEPGGEPSRRQDSPGKADRLVSGEQGDADSYIRSGAREGSDVPIQRDKDLYIPTGTLEGHPLTDDGDRAGRGARGGDSP